MKINRIMFLVAALCFTAVAATFASPQLGTWKLNESKSKFSGSSGKNTMVTYTAGKGGMMKVTAEGVDKEGRPNHWSWTGKFDGQPYKAKGNKLADMIAYKVMNDRANSLTFMRAGKVVATGTVTVARDGKSRMVVTNGTDASGKKFTDKAYYDKQ